MNASDKPMLTQFVRARDGQPRGMVVATVIDNDIRIGWSFTNTKAGDRFNKQTAVRIALGRAESGWSKRVKVPVSVQKVFDKMVNRSTNYFKGVRYSKMFFLNNCPIPNYPADNPDNVFSEPLDG